jgi:hypothetical protein
MRSYAEGTSVPVEKSKAELDGLLSRYGAAQRYIGANDATGEAQIGFTLKGRQYVLRLPLPKLADFATKPAPSRAVDQRPRARASEEQHAAWEQACRERWRAFTLLVKAKLEATQILGSTVEREFLADLVLPDGDTIGRAIAPKIAEAYQSGRMPPLFGPGGEGS